MAEQAQAQAQQQLTPAQALGNLAQIVVRCREWAWGEQRAVEASIAVLDALVKRDAEQADGKVPAAK